jgi:mRNA-degrading endonuclease HigB of HigAB toxin-antitoxin module
MNPKLKIEFLVSPDFDRELSNWYSTIFKKSFTDTGGARNRYCDCCILVDPTHVFDFLGLIRFIILGNAQRIHLKITYTQISCHIDGIFDGCW